MNTDESLVYFGGDVKATGAGRFAGHVVRWGSPDDVDVQNDYFTPETDFWTDVKACVAVVYHHGLDLKGDDRAAALRKRRLGKVRVRPDAVGLYGEGELDLAHPAAKSLYRDIEAGRIGFSSGSVDRLVMREEVRGKNRITQWPLIEVSLTPKPVEPRNRVYAVKALYGPAPGAAVAATLDARAEALVADAEAYVALIAKAHDQRRAEGRGLSRRKREAVKSLAEALGRIHAAGEPGPARSFATTPISSTTTTTGRVADLRRRLLLDRIED